MNPEMMTVISMRQKEMSYQHLSRLSTSATTGPVSSFFPPTHSAMASSSTTNHVGDGAFGFRPFVIQSPASVSSSSYYGTSKCGGMDTRSTCYSPLSVVQIPQSGGMNYDQLGFTWYWISEVCAHFALQRQTAHYAIQYAQRLLQQRPTLREGHGSYLLEQYDDIYVVQKELQMLGLVCVLIAAKIEEVHPPKGSELAEYISEHGAVSCAAEETVQYEAQCLVELKWNLHPTTVLSWLLFLLAGDAGDQPMETMGNFVDPKRAHSVRKDVFAVAANVIDAALLDCQAMDFLPSVLAGSAILIADPALDLVYVAQFLQLDPALLWECKNWLFAATSGLGEVEENGTRNEDRWGKVPREETLFIQTRVPVASHLAFGLLRADSNAGYEYNYSETSTGMLECSGSGTSYSSYPTTCTASPSLYDNYGCYCTDGYPNHVGGSGPPNVYHFKYGWQGADMRYDQPLVQRKLHFS